MAANQIDGGFLARNQICARFLFSPSLIASRCAVAMSTAAFTEDELLSMSPDLSGGGQPAGDGGDDVLVAGAGAGTRTRTRSGTGDEPVLFDADRGAGQEGGSGGSDGGGGGIAGGARGVAELLLSMEAAAARRSCGTAKGLEGSCRCGCICGLIGFTRMSPLMLCGLI